MKPPALVILGGLPGTGKTAVARELKDTLAHVRIDSIEQAMRDSGEMGPRGVEGAGYLVGQAVARDLLACGIDVVAECVNPFALTRQAWREAGRSAGAAVLEVELFCSDEDEHRRRVEERSTDIAGLELPDWSAVVEREYEAWPEAALHLDTAMLTAAEAADAIRAALGPLRSACLRG